MFLDEVNHINIYCKKEGANTIKKNKKKMNYQKNHYNNTVIKAVTAAEEDQVLDWWENNGVNVSKHVKWQPSKTCRYYGLINGVFSNYDLSTAQENNAKIINSPSELLSRGDKILVWDDSEKDVEERIFLSYIEGTLFPIICVNRFDEKKFRNKEIFDTVVFKNWKPLPKKAIVEVTLEEIAKLMGIKVEQLRIKK
jgi:hypothetical protein